MKYAICNEVYGDWSIERAWRHARDAGYQGIEIAPFTLARNVFEIDDNRRRHLRQTAQQLGLEIVGLHWLLAGTEGLHLTSGDAEVIEPTLEYLSALTRLCRDLGGRVMVLGSPDQRTLPPHVSPEKGRANAINLLQRLADVLQQCNVTLALEPLGPEETNFITTAHQAVELIEAIGSDFVRLHLDVKAMATEDQPIADIIRQHASSLVHFHANDPNRQGPGMGNVDFAPIVSALQDIQYTGWVSVEVFDYQPGIERLVGGSIQYLRSEESKLASSRNR